MTLFYKIYFYINFIKFPVVNYNQSDTALSADTDLLTGKSVDFFPEIVIAPTGNRTRSSQIRDETFTSLHLHSSF